MPHLNVEIKARTQDLDGLRAILLAAGADCRGEDIQTDTYFAVPNGRLKLRQGRIENALIHYTRPDQAGPKDSQVALHATHEAGGTTLLEALSRAVPVWVTVRKRREIFFIANVKFHLDTVEGLGTFVEIEAIDHDGQLGQAALMEQCEAYMQHLGIRESDLLAHSYSDMLTQSQP